MCPTTGGHCERCTGYCIQAGFCNSRSCTRVLPHRIAGYCGTPMARRGRSRVAGYFDAKHGQVETWWFSTLPHEQREHVAPFRVPRFHRTLSGWVEIICDAGFVIERFGEPSASLELARAEPVAEDTRVAPLFLHFRVRKPV